MTKISFLYPNTANSKFDMEYYVQKHMPWSISLLSAHPGFRGVSVERGLNGATPGGGPAYVAMCHFLFDSLDDFLAAVTPNMTALQEDMKNCTNVEPIFQVSEVLISC